MIRFWSVFILIIIASFSSSNSSSPVENRVGHWTANKILRIFQKIGETNIKQIFNDIMNGVETRMNCVVCKLAYKLAQRGIYSEKELKYLFYESCWGFNFETKRVCDGLANLFGDQIYFILRNTKLTPQQICGIVVGPKCMEDPCPLSNWTMPKVNTQKSVVTKQVVWNDSDERKTPLAFPRILHLSDLHVDPWYLAGASDGCNEPLCCRATSTFGPEKSGFWGGYYGCDSPERTIIELFGYINKTASIDYDYLIWTGDFSAHDVWNNSKQQIISGSRLLTSLIKSHLAADKLVFPAIGNHEGFPVNQFAPPEIVSSNFSSRWLYEELWNQWKDWLPVEAGDTFKQYGYYSRTVTPQFKVIVLNTNYCARLNFWLLYNPIDPGNQLKWLTEELDSAERNGQTVHIIGHIPIDNTQCVGGWVHNYLKVVERYQNLIAAQFFGHTHLDELRIFYTKQNTPAAVAYLAPSVTPYEKLNPAFRLYRLNQYADVEDHETYFLNLTEANAHPNVKPLLWKKEYNAKEAYGMSSLEPIEWDLLVKKMQNDADLFQSFYNHYHRYSSAFPSQCLSDCRTDLLAEMQIFDPVSC